MITFTPGVTPGVECGSLLQLVFGSSTFGDDVVVVGSSDVVVLGATDREGSSVRGPLGPDGTTL